MSVTPEDIQAATDVVRQAGEESDGGIAFELAVGQRDELIRLKKAVEETISLIDTELIRQLETGSKDVGKRTFRKAPKKTARYDHEKILARAWRRAMADATNVADGTVDWDLLGQAMREIVTDLYLSPSLWVKAGGLKFLGIERDEISTYQTNGYELKIYGEDE